MTAHPLPEEVIREALTACKLVYKPHINEGRMNNMAVLKVHVEPFAADPQYVIGKLYKRCAEMGFEMSAIVWGAASHQYPGCSTFQFTVKPKKVEP